MLNCSLIILTHHVECVCYSHLEVGGISILRNIGRIDDDDILNNETSMFGV